MAARYYRIVAESAMEELTRGDGVLQLIGSTGAAP